MEISAAELSGIAVAAGCGLLIGIDRERRKGTGPARAFAGLRSFALASTIGALAMALDATLVLVAAALVAALVAAAYWRDRSADPGITTELALFLSFMLGVAAIENPALAAGAAVTVAVLLHLRSPLHHFARVSLTKTELRDLLVFAGAALVVRPLLPDAGTAWLLGVNPKTLWTLVIVIMAIQAAAHVGLRLAGARLGLAVSGFGAGFVSGVATIAAMGTRCRNDPALLASCVAGALLSNIATYVLLWAVAATVAPGYLGQLAPVLASVLAAAVTVGAVAMLRQRGAQPLTPSSGRAFDIRQALLFAVLLSGATSVLALLNAHVGKGALVAGSGLAGFFDLHAAAASALALLESGAAQPRDAMLGVLLAISTNSLSKAAGALAGGIQYALRINASLALVLLAAWLPFLLSE